MGFAGRFGYFLAVFRLNFAGLGFFFALSGACLVGGVFSMRRSTSSREGPGAFGMTTNPWNVPPLPEKGDRKDSTTYEAVGRALTAWEGFEECLAIVFAALVVSSLEVPIERAYGSVIAFKARLEMVVAAAEAHFKFYPNKELRACLRAFLRRAADYGARRNEIAHGMVGRLRTHLSRSSGYGVIPPRYNTGKFALRRVDVVRAGLNDRIKVQRQIGRPKYAYTSIEIMGLVASFEEMGQIAAHLWVLIDISRSHIDELREKGLPLRPSPTVRWAIRRHLPVWLQSQR